MITRRLLLYGAVSLVLMGPAWALQGHDENLDFPSIPFDHKAIRYLESPVDDPVARLQKQMERGDAKLEFDPKRGYLPSVLENLGINIDSQVLVFSKTSFQNSRISAASPRAIYFHDTVSVGSVQGGQVLEVAALDPRQGMVFYTLDDQKSDAPSFNRQDMSCLQCHMGPATLNVPGIVVSSVYRSDDSPALRARAFATDHRIPLEDRWGGWYVTGRHGTIVHRGNVAVDSSQMPTGSDLRRSQNLTRLDDKFDTSAYLSPASDIVALLTLEHQTRLTNLITRIGWETRIAAANGTLEALRRRLDFEIEEMVTYMLFADEAPMRERIEGVSAFSKTFPQHGPRDRQGRSLRDFDLEKRLFRYPLSYMVYSEAFDSLPDIARERILRALYDVLTSQDANNKFARLSAEDRRAVWEILRDTKPNLPAYWKTPASGQ